MPAFAVLTCLSLVLEFVAVELPHGGSVSVATIAHIATIFLVPPPFAALSVGTAVLVEELIHRRPLARLVFNTSSYVLTIGLASLVVSLIGNPRVLVAHHDHLPLVAMVVLVSLVYYVLNDLMTAAIMALAGGRSLSYIVRMNGRSTALAEAGAGMIGVLFALIWIVEPLWTTLLAIPGAVIARALQYIRQLERETRSAVSSLAKVVDHRDASTFHHSERARARMNLVTPALSLTGDVFGMHATAVNPPATADARPVAIVSLCSCPGSRRCTCMSIRPGQTTSPPAPRRPRRRRPADPPDARDAIAVDQHVERAVAPVRRVDDPAALKQPLHLPTPPASRYSTAMRTATPLATCSRITEYGPSATSEAISTPRFIGPGCMMIASGLARRTRSRVMPNTLKYSRSDGKNAPCIRSSWMRSIMIDVRVRRPPRRPTS